MKYSQILLIFQHLLDGLPGNQNEPCVEQPRRKPGRPVTT